MDMETRTFETPGKSGKGSINWEPEFTTPVIMRSCKVLGIKIGKAIMEIKKFMGKDDSDSDKGEEEDMAMLDALIQMFFDTDVEAAYKCVWFMVAVQASELGIKEREFYELLPPMGIMDVIAAVKTAIMESLPQKSDMGDIAEDSDDEQNPKDPGA